MIRYKPYVIFLSIVAGGIVVSFLVGAGYYPVAFVGTTVITARDFTQQYAAAATYSSALEKMYPSSSTDTLDPASGSFQAAVLERIIENVLVHRQLAQEVGSATAGLVANKIDRYDNDDKLHTAASTLFGMTFADFRERILIPQAERELLSGRLLLKGEQFDPWLHQAKSAGRVVIVSSRFRWDGGRVQVH